MSGIWRARTVSPNSNERLMTSARLRAAKRIPREIAALSPSPLRSSTRTGMIFAPNASPVTPTPLSTLSAIVDATCVPCPLRSCG